MAKSRGGMVMLLLFVAMLAATHQSASATEEGAPKGVTLSFPPFNSKFTCSIDPAIGVHPKYICTPTTDPTSLALSYDNDVVSARYQYKTPVQLWKKNSKYVASFSASFVVNFDRSSEYTIKHLFGGGGLAFAITPSLSVIGSNSESLGLFEIDQKTGNPVAGVSSAKTVAVEIDVSRNGENWDPAIPHIGLDVNSVKSVKTKYLGDPNNFDDHKIGVWIDYNALTGTIQVRTHQVKQTETPDKKKSQMAISYKGLDLASTVNDFSYVGFSSRVPKTPNGIYRIYNWKFTTTWVLGTKMH